ncbi:MAG: ankyrin repeat domain-containing protein [Cyanobacteria bacterium P01_F01_bin.143]
MSNRQASIDLFYAAKEGNLDKARRAINDGANVNMHSNWYTNTSPLHEAAFCMPSGAAANCGHIEVAKLLIENGADVNARCNHWAMTPLHAAITSRNDREDAYYLANLLLDNGADSNIYAADGETAFQKLVLEIRQFQDENGNYRTVYDIAGTAGLMKTIEKAIAKDAKINASSWKNLNLCQILKAEGIYADPTIYTPQGQQYTEGRKIPLLKMADFLEKQGGEYYTFNRDNSQKLIDATLNNDTNVNFAMRSALSGDKFSSGGDVNVRLPEGNNYSSLISELIYRLDTWNVDQQNRSFDKIKFLVSNGASVNTQNKDYLCTPLHYLLFEKIIHHNDANNPCYQNLRKIADYLVSKGADIHAIRCDGGKNLLQINQERGNNSLINDFLQKNGCTQAVIWEMV